jgi:hypothetical protein
MAMSNERTNITELNLAGYVIGWTYMQDGEWYATTKTDDRVTVGPFKQHGDASDALVRMTYLIEHTVDGDVWPTATYLLMMHNDGPGMHDRASGSVTWMTTDKPDGESVTWTVGADGTIDMNAMSGVGTPRNAEAKGAAMLEAVKQAQAAVAAMAVTA